MVFFMRYDKQEFIMQRTDKMNIKYTNKYACTRVLFHRQIGSKPYLHVLICKPNIGCVDILYVYMHKTGTLH